MASYNKVVLMGNVTRDVETRYLPSGAAVCEIGLAVNDRKKTPQGEWVNEAMFIDVTLWNRTAEIAGEYLQKGSPVLIEGRLRMDTWEQDGQKRSKLKVTADQMVLLGSRNQGGPDDGSGNYSNRNQGNNRYQNNQGGYNQGSYGNQGGYNQGGYGGQGSYGNQGGYNQGGYNQGGYAPDGYDPGPNRAPQAGGFNQAPASSPAPASSAPAPAENKPATAPDDGFAPPMTQDDVPF